MKHGLHERLPSGDPVPRRRRRLSHPADDWFKEPDESQPGRSPGGICDVEDVDGPDLNGVLETTLARGLSMMNYISEAVRIAAASVDG